MSTAQTSTYAWRTTGVEETIELGRKLGALLRAGDVLILTGDLGAGKTQLTKGIASGMGVADDVTSPTFNILMVYEGADLPLYHFDLYRLEDASELEDTGIYDLLGGDGPCVIEWGEQFADEIGDERLDVFITRLDDELATDRESLSAEKESFAGAQELLAAEKERSTSEQEPLAAERDRLASEQKPFPANRKLSCEKESPTDEREPPRELRLEPHGARATELAKAFLAAQG